MERIAIVGTTGSGKTTLGERLSDVLDYSFVDLDSLAWEPNWTQPSTEVMTARFAAALAG